MSKAERDVEDAKWLVEQPMRDWKRQMKDTDEGMPRYVEDLIDALNGPTKARLATETLDKYNEKKTLRDQKPT